MINKKLLNDNNIESDLNNHKFYLGLGLTISNKIVRKLDIYDNRSIHFESVENSFT